MHRRVNILERLVRIAVLEPIAANDPVRQDAGQLALVEHKAVRHGVDVDQAANIHVVSAPLGHRKRRSGDGDRVMLEVVDVAGALMKLKSARALGHVLQVCNVGIVGAQVGLFDGVGGAVLLKGVILRQSGVGGRADRDAERLRQGADAVSNTAGAPADDAVHPTLIWPTSEPSRRG
jgi:hypothetical protein